jgi:hypothetical protein
MVGLRVRDCGEGPQYIFTNFNYLGKFGTRRQTNWVFAGQHYQGSQAQPAQWALS